MPPGFEGSGLACYRVLLPLHNDETDTFRPWTGFLPGDTADPEPLRAMDLRDLQGAATSAGIDMTGWDSPRGKVSPEFLGMLRTAIGEIVPGDAAWTWLRWEGYGNCAPGATRVTVGDRHYCEQTAGQEELWASVEALGMPDFLW